MQTDRRKFSITMTTYLITGVNKGIGLALLKAAASNSDNLVIGTVRNQEKAKQIEDLGFDNVKVLIIDMTLTDGEFQEAFKDLEKLTPNGIQTIIHNAGVTLDHIFNRPIEDFLNEDFESMFRVNVMGAAKFYKAICPRLEKNSGPAKLIFISSIGGMISELPACTGPYGASKAALNSIVKQISIQRKPKNDIVVPVHPGAVDTEMTDEIKQDALKRANIISTDKSATLILKLASKLTLDDTGKFFSHDGTVLTY